MSAIERASQLVHNEYYFISGAGVVLFMGQMGNGSNASFVFKTVRKKVEIKLNHSSIGSGILHELPSQDQIDGFFEVFSRSEKPSRDFMQKELDRYHELSACLHGAGILKIAEVLRNMTDFMMENKSRSTSLSNMDTRMFYELANLSREMIVYSRHAKPRQIDRIQELTSLAA